VQWTGSGDGTWADESQWNQNVVPNGVGAVANLLPAGSAPSHLITLGAPVTVGVLNFDSPSAYQLQGAMLSLEAPSGASTSITVRSGEHRIDAR
jgi:hypothetical protein